MTYRMNPVFFGAFFALLLATGVIVLLEGRAAHRSPPPGEGRRSCRQRLRCDRSCGLCVVRFDPPRFHFPGRSPALIAAASFVPRRTTSALPSCASTSGGRTGSLAISLRLSCSPPKSQRMRPGGEKRAPNRALSPSLSPHIRRELFPPETITPRRHLPFGDARRAYIRVCVVRGLRYGEPEPSEFASLRSLRCGPGAVTVIRDH